MRSSLFLNGYSQSKNIQKKMSDELVSRNSLNGVHDQFLPIKTIATAQQNINRG